MERRWSRRRPRKRRPRTKNYAGNKVSIWRPFLGATGRTRPVSSGFGGWLGQNAPEPGLGVTC